MADGKVEIGVELNDKQAVSQASKLGKEVGSGIEGGVKGGTEKSGGLLNALKGKFSMAFAAIGGIVAGFSMASMAKQIVDTGKQFEESMSKVAALSGATGDDFDRLEAKARELGASTTFSASEAADALGYMALAGWDTEQMLDGVGSVLTLAQAGMMDLAQASDLVTDYLSAFGMEASETQRMVDVLAYAQANANTTVEGLGMAFKNCAANAHAAGLDVETTSAAISMMANQGLKGSEAGTALNAVFRDMTQKAEDGAIAIGDTNVAISDSQGNFRDLTDILRDVAAATEGMGNQEKQAALMTTFTADSIKGLNLLLAAGTDELVSFRDELYNSSGAGKQLADTMTDNLEGDIKALNSALEELQLKIYDSLKEPLRDAAQFATNVVVPAITTLVQNFDKIAPILATVGVALLAYRKNWDIVTTAQKLAAKAAASNTAAFTKYFSVVKNGETVFYKWDKATKSYVTTQGTLRAKLATTTAGIKAQEIAQKASNTAMEIGGKVANTLGKALKTMAPVAVISAVIELASRFAEAAESAEKFKNATDGLREVSSSYASAMQEASDGTVEYTTSVRDLIEENKKVIESQSDLADSIRETWSGAGSSAGLAEKYTATIEELTGKLDANGKKVKLTADEQARLKMAVEGLNSVTGENYTIIDAVNGELSVNTAQLRKNTEQWKANAKAQAAQESVKKLYSERIQKEEQLSQTIKAREQAENELANTENMTWAFEQNRKKTVAELTGQEEALRAEIDAIDESIGFMEDSYISATEATKDAAEASAENAEALDGTAQSMEKVYEATEDTIKAVIKARDSSDAFADMMERAGYTTESLASTLEITGVSCDELAKSIESMAEKTADAFSEIEDASEASLDDMIETLQKNRKATENWSSNIQTLYERAGSESERRFIGYMSSLGPEYSRQVQALVDDTSGKLTTLADEWAAGMEAGSDAAMVQAGLMADGVALEITTVADTAYTEGQNVGEQMGQGIADSSETVSSAAETTAADAVQAMADEAAAKMPLVRASMTDGTSAAMEAAKATGRDGGTKAGTAAAQAEATAMNAMTPVLNVSGKNIAKAGSDGAASENILGGGYDKAGKGGATAYGGGIESKKPLVKTQAGDLASEAADSMDKSGEARKSGQNLAQGFIDGMGSMLRSVIDGAASLAASAIGAIKKTGKEGSPWRTTIESGEWAGAGLAVGLENSENLVANRAGRLAKRAVRGIDAEGGSDGIAWDATKRSGKAAARGLVVGFEAADPMAQIEASIEQGVSAMMVAAASGSMGGTTNNQTINFNGSVNSPDAIARRMRMEQRYGLAGRR